MIPPALACGFGELGKHGSLINPELGASFRLSAVLTDAPFAVTSPAQHGIDIFCQSCRVCEDACPPEAIAPIKQMVRSERLAKTKKANGRLATSQSAMVTPMGSGEYTRNS